MLNFFLFLTDWGEKFQENWFDEAKFMFIFIFY